MQGWGASGLSGAFAEAVGAEGHNRFFDLMNPSHCPIQTLTRTSCCI